MLNFRLVSDFQTVNRRSFTLAAPAILKPTNVRPLVDGEWLQHDAAYSMARGGDNIENAPGVPDDEATVPSWPVFMEQGRYDTQAIGKTSFLYLNAYEAETKIMCSTDLIIGDKLAVWDVVIGGIVRRGLAEQSSGFIVGYVTRTPATNGGWLRFVHF